VIDPRQTRREDTSRRAVAAAASLARKHGPRVNEPAVLADLFSVMEWDLALLHGQDPDAVAKHHSPDELRAVYLALCLGGFREVFGDMPDWGTTASATSRTPSA
jgi:hypothetical protein